METTNFVDSLDWLLAGKVWGEASARLLLFDEDVRSVQLAWRDYSRLREVLHSSEPDRSLASTFEMFHHAKTFVCAVRRVGRLADALSANGRIYGPVAAKEIKAAWKRKKASFRAFVEPRNAIEHMDGELLGRTSWKVMNLENDVLCVTDSKRAPVDAATVALVVSLRAEIVRAVVGSIDATPTA